MGGFEPPGNGAPALDPAGTIRLKAWSGSQPAGRDLPFVHRRILHRAPGRRGAGLRNQAAPSRLVGKGPEIGLVFGPSSGCARSLVVAAPSPRLAPEPPQFGLKLARHILRPNPAAAARPIAGVRCGPDLGPRNWCVHGKSKEIVADGAILSGRKVLMMMWCMSVNPCPFQKGPRPRSRAPTRRNAPGVRRFDGS